MSMHSSPYSPAAAADTIVAVATPAGRGGVGIIRISGQLARAALDRLFQPAAPGPVKARELRYGRIIDPHNGRMLDDAMAVFMPGPRSFTGEDVVEFHCHGSPVILGEVVNAALSTGCRHAERGEFSYRAFLNGRMDLSQAEAVAEMIAAVSPRAVSFAQARLDGEIGRRVEALRTRLLDVRAHLCLAVDFPDDEVECLPLEEFLEETRTVAASIQALLAAYDRAKVWQHESRVVLAGRVNAGKSSLLNALLGRRRALVSDVPGTTRDWLEEVVNLDGLFVRLVDTAGLRETPDSVEIEGIAHSREQIDGADAVLLVVDAAQGLGKPEHDLLAQLGRARQAVLVVFNKTDMLEGAPSLPSSLHCVAISAKNGQGLDELAREIRHILLHGRQHDHSDDLSTASPNGHGSIENGEESLAPNARQADALGRALDDLQQLEQSLLDELPYDIAAVHLDAAVAGLAEVTGRAAPDEVLNRVFSEFCIGK